MTHRRSPKEWKAADLAEQIAISGDTDVTPEDVKRWPSYDLYDWLEAWDYEWNGSEWVYAGEES
jgi:hypothetical protein